MNRIAADTLRFIAVAPDSGEERAEDYFVVTFAKDFFARLNRSLDSGVTFDRAPFAESSCEWEQRWSRATDRFRTVPQGDPVVIARTLVTKWRSS